MNKMSLKGFIWSLFLIGFYGQIMLGQEYKVHSHNDYQHEFPFLEAYVNNAASIEVDLFLKNGKLYVTHEESEITEGNTLSKLYLDPLKMMREKGKLRNLQLLIDLKSEAEPTLTAIQKVLKKYPNLLKGEQVKFVISGNRPKPSDYVKYPDYILFDHQSIDDLDSIPLEKVAMVSLSFQRFSVWNGYGRMVSKELETVRNILDRVHAHGKPFRFWATPDTKTAWARFAKLGVDYINTDKPAQANDYLTSLNSNLYSVPSKPIYKPTYSFEYGSKPKNVILMIGDGNGLAQITSAMIANKGQLSMANIKDIALVKTSSHDDLITDSAAGATAIATGNKTNNRAIGLGPNDEVLTSIMDIVSQKGYRTGIITTDAIIGATPSSFYAHVKDRDNSESILRDLKNSKLDFFISGGKSFEPRLKDVYRTSELDGFNDLKRKTAVYLGDNKMPSIESGRGNMLPNSIEKSLSVLSKTENPFFMLVEGAQIDNGGHSNSVSTIVNEMLDFDAAVAEALKFADKTGNTLVLITADHETSGFGIIAGDLQKGEIQGDFLTIDHTAIMVPLFAYGPQADQFKGVYENSEIFLKLKEVLEIEK